MPQNEVLITKQAGRLYPKHHLIILWVAVLKGVEAAALGEKDLNLVESAGWLNFDLPKGLNGLHVGVLNAIGDANQLTRLGLHHRGINGGREGEIAGDVADNFHCDRSRKAVDEPEGNGRDPQQEGHKATYFLPACSFVG